MNVSTLIGFLCCFAVFMISLLMTTKDVGLFLNSHAILLVIGGTMAASFVCFSFGRVFSLSKVFVRRMLGKSKQDYLGLIAEIVALAQASRRGKPAFQAQVQKITFPFLRDAVQILAWQEADVKKETLRSILETRAETHYERYLDEADIFKTMSKFPPAFGLLGTTLGMIALLKSLGTEGGKGAIGPSMAIALIATLYGIGLANFVFIPISENLSKQAKEDLISRRIVVEGIMLIADSLPAQLVEEYLKSFLLPSERGSSSKANAIPVAGPMTNKKAS